jgi:hypothetical protein
MYLIPILFFAIYYINFYKTKEPIKIREQNKTIIKKDSQLTVIKYFENISKTFNLIGVNLELNNNILNISCNSRFKNIMLFFNAGSNEYKLLSYNMYKENKTIFLNILYNTNINIEQKSSNNKYNHKNPFIKVPKLKVPKLKAVIGNFVFINSKWYKLHDKYKQYIITKIYKKSIVLSNKNKTFTMEIF